MNHSDDEMKFRQQIDADFGVNTSPYGGPPVKPGPTRRMKVAGAAAGVVVLGGGALAGIGMYQSANETALEEKRVELSLKQAEMKHERDMARLAQTSQPKPTKDSAEPEDSGGPVTINAAHETEDHAQDSESGSGSATLPAGGVLLLAAGFTVWAMTGRKKPNKA